MIYAFMRDLRSTAKRLAKHGEPLLPFPIAIPKSVTANLKVVQQFLQSGTVLSPKWYSKTPKLV